MHGQPSVHTLTTGSLSAEITEDPYTLTFAGPKYQGVYHLRPHAHVLSHSPGPAPTPLPSMSLHHHHKARCNMPSKDHAYSLQPVGDNWTLTITVSPIHVFLRPCDTHPAAQVEEIVPVAEGTGKVMVIDGAGACPREDGGGSHVWIEDLRKLRSGTVRERNGVLSEITCALNYKGAPVTVDFAGPSRLCTHSARRRSRSRRREC